MLDLSQVTPFPTTSSYTYNTFFKFYIKGVCSTLKAVLKKCHDINFKNFSYFNDQIVPLRIKF